MSRCPWRRCTTWRSTGWASPPPSSTTCSTGALSSTLSTHYIYTWYLHIISTISTISTHYIYNIYRCTILVLLPIEIGTGFLEKLTGRISFLYTLCSSLKSTVSTVYELQKYMLDTYFSKLNLLKLNFILQHFKTILNTNTNPIITSSIFPNACLLLEFWKCSFQIYLAGSQNG